MTETDPDQQYSDDGERENPDGPRPEDEQDDEAREKLRPRGRATSPHTEPAPTTAVPGNGGRRCVPVVSLGPPRHARHRFRSPVTR